MKKKYQRCSPHAIVSNNIEKGKIQTCFSLDSLEKIANKYNAMNPSAKISMVHDRKKLWHEINKKIPECHDDKCWISSRFLDSNDKTELLEDFKPPIPRGKFEWLSTNDIDLVLEGYAKVFPEFVYMGAHPLDFETYRKSMNPVKIIHRAIKDKKKNAAMVLNMDESSRPGSHWVALFFDIPERIVEYFDSVGDKAPPEVHKFFQKIHFDRLKENTYVHQQKDSECGVYSIHFIVRRLLGQSFEHTVKHIIKDDKMNSMRQIFFDPL